MLCPIWRIFYQLGESHLNVFWHHILENLLSVDIFYQIGIIFYQMLKDHSGLILIYYGINLKVRFVHHFRRLHVFIQSVVSAWSTSWCWWSSWLCWFWRCNVDGDHDVVDGRRDLCTFLPIFWEKVDSANWVKELNQDQTNFHIPKTRHQVYPNIFRSILGYI